jgi:hypothetical protein
MKEKDNQGQGDSGRPISAPDNIPPNEGGAEFGTNPPDIGKVEQSPKETSEDGLGGDYPGSNKSSFDK